MLAERCHSDVGMENRKQETEKTWDISAANGVGFVESDFDDDI